MTTKNACGPLNKNIIQINDSGIHNEGLRLSIGTFRISPIDSILNYVGEIPFQPQRDKNTLIYITLKKSITNHIGYKTIFKKHNIFPKRDVVKKGRWLGVGAATEEH